MDKFVVVVSGVRPSTSSPPSTSTSNPIPSTPIASSSNESTTSNSDSNNGTCTPKSKSKSNKPKMPTKTSAKKRHWEYQKQTFVDSRSGLLFCKACNIVLDHTRKSSVDVHLKSNKKHKLNLLRLEPFMIVTKNMLSFFNVENYFVAYF